jgi:hypothetical protein
MLCHGRTGFTNTWVNQALTARHGLETISIVCRLG